MVGQDQKSRIGPSNIFTNQRGQAVVEYILLLVVIVSLILGAKRAFSNVNQFMSNYIGDYVACLMEYGELPSLEVGEAELKKHLTEGKVCEANFGDFSFASGVPYTGGGGSTTGPGGTGSSGPGSSARNRTDSSRSNMANSRNSSRNGENSGSNGGSDSANTLRDATSGSSSGSGRGGRSPYARGTIRRASAGYGTGDAGAGADDNVKVIEDPNSMNGSNARRGGRRGRYRGNRYVYNNIRYKAVTGRMEQEIEKTQPKKPPVKKASVVKLEEGSGIGPRKKAFTPPEVKREVASQTEESGFSFGNIFRWLLIAGMVIAIVIFFGGQLLNYSNSQD